MGASLSLDSEYVIGDAVGAHMALGTGVVASPCGVGAWVGGAERKQHSYVLSCADAGHRRRRMPVVHVL